MADARQTVVTAKAVGSKNNRKELPMERLESDVPVNALRVRDDVPEASVTGGYNTKVSDNVYYGDFGSWDRIPFSVEVFSSVTLRCDQTVESITMAQECARDLAFAAAQNARLAGVVSLVADIKERLFPGLFA